MDQFHIPGKTANCRVMLPGMSEAGCTVVSNEAMSVTDLLGARMELTIRTGEEPGSSRQDGVSFVPDFEHYLVSCADHHWTARRLSPHDICLLDRLR
jgi:hypothetical protein